MTQPNWEGPLGIDMASFERLIRIESKLADVIESKTNTHAEIVKDLADHETRIRLLERAWWKTVGVASGVGAMIGTGSAIAAKLIEG